jgi:hypothetical protein
LLQNQWSSIGALSSTNHSLTRSADGSVVGFSGAKETDYREKAGRYRVSDGNLKYISSTERYSPYRGVAVNSDGSQIAGIVGTDIYFYNNDFVYLRRVSGFGYDNGSPTNTVYHPNRALLYATLAGSSINGNDEVSVIDTATFQKRGSYNFETGFVNNNDYYYQGSNGRLKVSSDGTKLFAIVKGGISYVDLTNEIPVAQPDTFTVRANESVFLPVAANDTDAENGELRVVKKSGQGTSHTPYWDANSGIDYTPPQDFIGTTTMLYKVMDPKGAISAWGRVTINVVPANREPQANSQTVTADEDSSKSILLTASDADDKDVLSYNIVSQPTNGVLSGTAPNLTYTPNANFNGSDSFTFKANDGNVDSNTATVSIAVTPVNDAPVSSTQSVVTDEDTAKSITLAASDIDGNALTYSVVTQPTRGTLSGSGATLTYTPNVNFNGSDSFTFKANDGTVDSNIATVNISVSPVNDAPVASTQSVTTNEDTTRNITPVATDVDGDTLSFFIVSQPANGTVTDGSGNTHLIYTPKPNYNGPDSFQVKISDSKGGVAIATLNITVLP